MRLSGVTDIHHQRLVPWRASAVPAPLQEAGAAALNPHATYYQQLAADYPERGDVMLGVLRDAGLQSIVPVGAYYTHDQRIRGQRTR
jgi:aspartate/methionine/tyrosine aminotransferase